MKSKEANVSPESGYWFHTPSPAAEKLFFYPTILGHFIYLPGYHLHRSRFDHFLLMYIKSGSCRVETDGIIREAGKGSAVLLDCSKPHGYGSDTGWDALWMHFNGPMAAEYTSYLLKARGPVLVPENAAALQYEMENMIRQFESGEPVSEERMHEKITSILCGLMASGKEAERSSASSVRDAVSYLNEHFTESIQLEDLAARACLSPFYFSRLFQKETGMTFWQYVLISRLSFAKYLLKTTDLPIREIAERSGFSDASAFCAAFRKKEGISPGSYRRQS